MSKDKEEKGKDKEEKGKDKELKSKDKEEKGKDEEEKGKDKEEKGKDKEEKGKDGEEKSKDGEDKSKDGEEKSKDIKYIYIYINWEVIAIILHNSNFGSVLMCTDCPQGRIMYAYRRLNKEYTSAECALVITWDTNF